MILSAERRNGYCARTGATGAIAPLLVHCRGGVHVRRNWLCSSSCSCPEGACWKSSSTRLPWCESNAFCVLKGDLGVPNVIRLLVPCAVMQATKKMLISSFKACPVDRGFFYPFFCNISQLARGSVGFIFASRKRMLIVVMWRQDASTDGPVIETGMAGGGIQDWMD